MYSDWLGDAAFGAVFITIVTVLLVWNLILTVLVWKNRNFLYQLFPKSGERDIRKKFEEVFEEVTGFKNQLSSLTKQLSTVQEDSLRHTQKVKLIRYNPYDDVGGDQSFSVVFLDNLGDGVVITSLHTRAGTRVFAKPVSKTKQEKYDFSKEEEQLIKEAIK